MNRKRTAHDFVVQLGTKFRFDHIDGTPLWQITAAAGDSKWRAKILEHDSQGREQEFAGSSKVFSTAQIEWSLTAWRQVRESHDKETSFYKNIPLDTIVYYKHRPGQFVRSKVVEASWSNLHGHGHGKCLHPLELVGAWPAGYEQASWKSDIKKGKCFRPHSSNLLDQPHGIKQQKRTPKPKTRGIPAGHDTTYHGEYVIRGSNVISADELIKQAMAGVKKRRG